MSMILKAYVLYYKKIVSILIIILLVVLSSPDTAKSEDQSTELPECIILTHCVRHNWEVKDIEKSFKKIKEEIEKTPRIEIVEQNESYLHAEATTKWMRYVDDLEVMSNAKKNILQIRSESRVGIGDNGVNQKRVDDLADRMPEYIINITKHA